jgi:O-antigen ligase
MIPVTFIVALLTASRQVLIIQIPLITILLYIRYLRKTKIITKIIFLVVAFTGVLLAAPYISDIYEDSYLKTRNEMDIRDDGRMVLLKDAIDVGNRYFPIGVGPGNYIFYSQNRLFSHNTYTELYANEGVIGLWLYVWMVLLFIKRQWHRYKTSYDKQYLVFLVFGIIYIFDGFFYVFYPHLWLMGMFMLVAGHSETYYNTSTLKHKRHEG